MWATSLRRGRHVVPHDVRASLSVRVETSCELLVKSLRPLPDKWQRPCRHQDTRYRQRYVDLIVNPESSPPKCSAPHAHHPLHPRLPRCARFHGSRDADDADDFRAALCARPFVTHHNASTCDHVPCASRPHCISSAWWSAASNACTRSTAISATRVLSTRHNPGSSRCSSCTGRYADYHDLMQAFVEQLVVKRCAGDPRHAAD